MGYGRRCLCVMTMPLGFIPFISVSVQMLSLLVFMFLDEL